MLLKKGSIVSSLGLFFVLALSVAPLHINAQTYVTWMHLEGVSLTGNEVEKTDATTGSTAGASSVELLPAGDDGSITVAYDDIDLAGGTGSKVAFGFSRKDNSLDYVDIDYGFNIAGTLLYICESGAYTTGIGSLTSGDVLKIEIISGIVYYYKNASLLKTTTINTPRDLIIDLCLNKQGDKITNVETTVGKVLRVDPEIDLITPPSLNTGAITLNAMGGTAPYTYSWSNSATTASVTGLIAGTYTVTITDNVSDVLVKTFELGYNILWTNQVNIASSSGSYIKANASAYDNGGASSLNYIASDGDGWVDYTVYEPTDYYSVGLTPKDFDPQSNSTRYMWLFAGGSARAYKYGTTDLLGSHTITGGESFRLERKEDSILYKMNGVTLYHVIDPVETRYVIDVNFTSNNHELYDIYTNIGTPYGIFSNVIGLDPMQPGVSTGVIDIDVRGGTPPYTYSWSNSSTGQDITYLDAGVYTVTVTDALSATITETIEVGYGVAWENTANAAYTDNSIIKNSGGSGFNSGGSSLNYLAPGEDGKIVYTVRGGSVYGIIGFSEQFETYSNSDIDYGICSCGGVFRVMEEGTVVLNDGTKMLSGDVLMIERSGSYINYYINGELKHQTATDNNKVLVLDASLSTLDYASAEEILIDFGDMKDQDVLYWLGNTDSDWSTVTNWSYYPTAVGPSSNAEPSSSQTAHFASFAASNCNLDANEEVGSLYLASSFTGSLNTSGYSLTINNASVQNGGTINASSSDIYIEDELLLNDGTFNAGTSNIHLSGTIHETDNVFVCETGNVVVSDIGADIDLISPVYDLEFAGGITAYTLKNNLVVSNSIDIGDTELSLGGYDLLVTNASTSAISVTAGSGGITFGPGEFGSYLSWQLGSSSSSGYSVPIYIDGTEVVDIGFDVTSAGTGASGTVKLSTYATNGATAPTNTPMPSVVQTFFNVNGQNNGLYVADRYWSVEFENYSSNPTISLDLNYGTDDIGGANTIVEADLVAQPHGLTLGSTWGTSTGTVNTSLNEVVVTGVNTDALWVVVDNSSLLDQNLPLQVEYDLTHDYGSTGGMVQLNITGGIGDIVVEWDDIVSIPTFSTWSASVLAGPSTLNTLGTPALEDIYNDLYYFDTDRSGLPSGTYSASITDDTNVPIELDFQVGSVSNWITTTNVQSTPTGFYFVNDGSSSIPTVIMTDPVVSGSGTIFYFQVESAEQSLMVGLRSDGTFEQEVSGELPLFAGDDDLYYLYIQGGQASCFVEGVLYQNETTVSGGDEFVIKKEGSNIYFYKNGTEFKSAAITSTEDLYGFCHLSNDGFTADWLQQIIFE